jgi:Family of unknown function (DUF6600)
MTYLSFFLQTAFIFICYVPFRLRQSNRNQSGMKMRNWNKMPVAALAAIALLAAMADHPNRAQAAGASAAAPTETIAPAQVSLPPIPAEVLQMSEAGAGDAVVISFIQKSANAYSLDARQIIFLHDLGVSSAVLDALVKHGRMAASDQTAEALSEPENATKVSSTEKPPVTGPAADFYNPLAPYGTWVNVPAYGWCWQPTVVVVNPAWQPYCNNGCWLWTDQGWYWNSYYSWGWAPFHYGRWCRYPGYGWLWCPDNTWGPAWVCWRDYPGYCGWAPLPPGACFKVGVGWTFNGLTVGFNYGFGLGAQCFTFCDYHNFCQRHPYNHFWHGRAADRLYRGSWVDNDFAVDAQHRFINRGIAPSRIEAVTHTRIQPVSVNEWPYQAGRSGDFTAPDRLTRNGSVQVIYRPDHDFFARQNHFSLEHHAQSATHWDRDVATHEFTARHEVGSVSRPQAARSMGRQYLVPSISWNHTQRNTFAQQRGGIENSQATHSSSAPEIHRDYSDSRRFTLASHSMPAWHSAPAWRSAPAWHATPTWHSSRAWHSAPSRSWSGGTHIDGGTHFGEGSTHFGGGMASNGGFHR